MPALTLRTLMRGATALLLLGWLLWLGYDAWQQLHTLQTQANIAPPVTPPAPRETPDPLAIAQLFGVLPETADDSRPEVPLSVLAILQAHTAEHSRALIASPEGSRFYHLGELLPGGAVLRQINATDVLIQRLGNEQSLPLNIPNSSLLTPISEAEQQPADAASGRLVQLSK
ncbi:type II secretion system protein N [Ectopseudomonas mendocina]|uniref:Type II secretion system protein N n=1 Tax=Ectopseudomonas mendocina TaxID=300 RepID=A0ABZ2RC87_ECTME